MKKLQLALATLLLATSCGLVPHHPPHTITFRGSAEIKAVPDLATFNFTIREEDKDATSAQQKMAKKTNAALDLLTKKGVAKKDIQTGNYNTNPKYEYQAGSCQKGICQPSKQVLTGFEASQTISLKLRDLAKASQILTDLAALKISEINGPNFSVENTDKLKSEAQALAIAKAKEQAATTAKNLGVTLKKIVNFAEEGQGFQPRMVFAKSAMAFDSGARVAPQLEAGEDKITSAVLVTYEIE
ncbi:MAG: SIMPL domain-containing protein [Rickettsiales bacterium]|nr:SIMPL domain-containing protein [Rickettsiales bacterium]